MKGLGVETVARFDLLRCSTAPVRRGLLIAEVLQWHSDTPRSIGLLWASDRPVVEIFTRQTPNTTQIFIPPAWFEPILILSCSLRPGLPSSFFPSALPTITVYIYCAVSPTPYAWHVPSHHIFRGTKTAHLWGITKRTVTIFIDVSGQRDR
jgi:hypothetical protein